MRKRILAAAILSMALPMQSAFAAWNDNDIVYSREILKDASLATPSVTKVSYPAGGLVLTLTDAANNPLAVGDYRVVMSLNGADWDTSPVLQTGSAAISSVSEAWNTNTNEVTFTFSIVSTTGAQTLRLGRFDIEPGQTLVNGGSVSLTALTESVDGSNTFSTSTQADVFSSDWSVGISATTQGARTIDVSLDRMQFVGNTGLDNSGSVTYALSPGRKADGVTAVTAADFECAMTFGGASTAGLATVVLSSTTSTTLVHDTVNNEFKATAAGTPCLDAQVATINLSGTVAQDPRSFSLTNVVRLAGGTNDLNTLATNPVTVWDMNGTVLYSTFSSGGAGYEQSFWLTNYSTLDARVSVKAWGMSADDTNASVQLGGPTATMIGTLKGITTRGFQLSDIESALGVTMGGLTWIEFTIESPSASGNALLGTLMAGQSNAVYATLPMTTAP